MQRYSKSKKRKPFIYRRRDPASLLKRIGVEPPKPKPKAMSGASTLIHKWWMLLANKRQLTQLENDLDDFLDKRPGLKTRFEAFMAHGGGDETALRKWLKQENNDGPLATCKHLRLMVDNDRVPDIPDTAA